MAGRPPGSQNIVTAEVREVFAKVFHSLQIDETKPFHLAKWAQENPKDFYTMATKLIPVQMTGANGKDLIPTDITLTFRKAPEMVTVIGNEA